MHESSLLAIVVTKYAEMFFQLAITAALIAACVKMITILDGEAKYITAMSVVSCVLAVAHLVHN